MNGMQITAEFWLHPSPQSYWNQKSAEKIHTTLLGAV